MTSSMHGRIVSIDQFANEMGKVIDELISSDLQDACGRIAYEVVKEYRPEIKSKANSKIKRNRQVYVNNFVSVPKKDTHGFYGAVLWNKQYTLSHLVEDPHNLWFGGRTHNDYEFFKDTEKPMNEEFSKRCREKVTSILRDL